MISISSRFLVLLVIIIFFILYILLQTQSFTTHIYSNSNKHEITSTLTSFHHLINNETIKKTKIAYIFAGGVRSFVCPKVHWSIRLNLIDALGGDPSTFIRLSVEDNINTKTGKGKLSKPSYKLNEVEETLKVLSPKKIEYFSFADQEEEMKRTYQGDLHTIYRENDLRRYSMFYHRSMSYKLMLSYEQEHNVTFDWVVLTRLDAAWLEPVLSITAYNSDRVWLTETGIDLFNDQFMLIPRQYSDHIYDLDTKVEKGVYCLGKGYKYIILLYILYY